jgi:rod shape-determining protein MreD
VTPGYTYLLASILGLILQGSVLRELLPFGLVPNFIAIVVVHLSFFWHRQYAVWLVFLLGLLADLFGSNLILGPNASAAVLVYLSIAVVSKRLYIESQLTLSIVVFFATLFNRLIAQTIISQFVESDSIINAMIRHAPFEALGSVIFAQLVFWVFKKVGLGRKTNTKLGGISWAE